MKKNIKSSLLTAEIAAFGMLMLLFFLNTSKPYLLLVIIAEMAGSYFLAKSLLRKWKAVPLLIALSVLVGAIIATTIIALV
jgi:hypothetical protein